MYLKHRMSSVKTPSKDANYYGLATRFKFSSTSMEYAHDNQEDFSWVVMRHKDEGKGGRQTFWD